MPYNIDTWKTEKIENLKIPIASFFKHARHDWHPIINRDGDSTTLKIMDSEIYGAVVDGFLVVEKMNISGEGSGTAMRWIVEPALGDSTGELVASCVWEGGDAINKISVIDGIITWEGINI